MTSRYQMELRVAAEEDDDSMVKSEMEGAEALAALRGVFDRGGGASGLEGPCRKGSTAVTASRQSSQDYAIAVFHGNASTMGTSALDTEETVRILPHKLCSTSYQSTSCSKFRKNLTEAEKEARRLRRVLANRESARQTICRRQAMHMELTRKAAHLTDENENLKKKKELAVKEYNSLKGRNTFLKQEMDNVNKAEPRETQEEPKSSQAEIVTSATIGSSLFYCNQPSLVPLFWPFLPSSNVIQMQYASNSDVMGPSQLSLRHGDISSSHLGQEVSLGTSGPGNPLFVLPVPWFLPLPGYSTTLDSYSNKRRNRTSPTHHCSMSSSSETLFVKDSHELSSNLNVRMENSSCARSMSVGSAIGAGFAYPVDGDDHYTGHHPNMSCVRHVEGVGPAKNSQDDNIHNLTAISATEHMLPKQNPEQIICSHTRSETISATRARSRRKELIRLKNIQCHHVRSQSANQ